MANADAAATETTVSRLTSAERGAIGTVVVAGPRAWECVAGLFHPANRANDGPRRESQAPSADQILFGRWGSSQGEEVVVRRRDDADVEIHCHGGHAASAAVVAALELAGCRPLEWPQALAAADDDPLVAPARLALAAARTERAARVLLWQLNGALREARLQEIDRQISAGDLAGGRTAVQAVVDRTEFGRHLVRPWRVVLAGPPNVGKSSLINALVGYSRSIVFDLPGTTRDVVTALTAFDGWPVELMDTAGLGDATDALEKAGVELAHDQLAQADLVVLVFDATQSWSAADRALVERWPNAIVVRNKCDLLADEQALAGTSGLFTSAIRRAGLSELESEIARRLAPQPPIHGDAVPIGNEQISMLGGLLAALEAGNLAAASKILRAALAR